MSELYLRFSTLPNTGNEGERIYEVTDISEGISHKLGRSTEGYPIVFVECSDAAFSPNIQMKLFDVAFNQECTLRDVSRGEITKKYTIFQLKSTEIDYQQYFIEVVCLVLRKLAKLPKVKDLKTEIVKIINLFTESKILDKKIIKGLWAELFVIANSTDPLYLVKSWHVDPDDKYDFNDSVDKLEVKATSSTERIHSFSIEQLNPNKDSNLAIISIIVAVSGMGVNMFDLIQKIGDRIHNIEAISKVKELVYETIGPNISQAKNSKFDISMAQNYSAVYDYRDVPSIKLEDVPNGVTSVKFSSCLKDIPRMDIKKSNSKLIKALK